MDRGLVHKSSSPLVVGEMGEAAGHGWWSVNNLRPPFEQHHQHHPPPSLFMPSSSTTTTADAAPSSPALHSFSSLLLANHYPLPPATTSTSPWPHDSGSGGQQGLGQQQDSWSQLILGGLVNGEERYNKQEGQMLFPIPTTIGSEAAGGGSGYIYSTATASSCSHGSGTTTDEIQLPWGGSSVRHHQHPAKASQQNKGAAAASSPIRSSSVVTTTTSTTTSLPAGSNMLEFSNNSNISSPRECISTASGSASKKARTQEPSPTQSTVKVRKEKLGDRITALHQLVSPFGKTDTASVLLEAIGYIRFLHSQIEALSLPYVGGSSNVGGGGGCGSSIISLNQRQHEASVQQGQQGESRHGIFPEDPGQLLHDNTTAAMKKRELLLPQHEQLEVGIIRCDEEKKDLRSRGLCLVPVSCTLDVGVDVMAGPADYWGAAPAFGMGFGR